MNTHQTRQGGEPVDRKQVDGVHDHYPAEHRQSQRRYECTVTVHDTLGLFFDQFNQHLDASLEAAGYACGCLPGCGAKQQNHN